MQEGSTTLTEAFLDLIRTPDLPGLGPEARDSRRPANKLQSVVDEFSEDGGLTEEVRECLRAAALLWHDHLTLSHTVSQGIPSGDGSFLHGIMHRREPDYGNAAYWFRRVGEHPAFPKLAEAVPARLRASEAAELVDALTPNGRWDPFAMIRACEVALRVGDPVQVEALKEVQRLEFENLVKVLLS
jgi:hypothetical protein